MKMGTQIAYVPLHVAEQYEGGAKNALDDSAVEFGFVMSEAGGIGEGESHFCRYWRKGHLGELRTMANSERTPTSCLMEYVSVDQAVVEKTIDEILGILPGLRSE